MEDKRTPEAIYSQIASTARHPKSKKAIENIKVACDRIDGEELPISISAVGSITKNLKGGPTTPSLRNNKEFVAYVDARAMQQKFSESANNVSDGSYRTDDPEINAIIYMLEAQRKAAESKLRCVTMSLANSEDFDLGEFLKQKKMTLATLPRGQVPPPEANPKNKKLGEALAKLLDPKHLEPFGLVLDNNRVKSPERNSRVFLEKSDVQVLRAEIERQR